VPIQRPPRIQTDRSASAAVRRTPMTRQRSSAPLQLHVTLKCIISTALQRNHDTPGGTAALHWH
jgi:IS30 family transposase